MENKKLVTTNKIMQYLISKDTVFEYLYQKFGLLQINLHEDIYKSIISNIIGQQLSDKAKNTIYNRLLALVKEIKPCNILEQNNDEIRACGISYSKIKYIKDLSTQIVNKIICLENFIELDDENLLIELKKINGIGIWTAEMLALFTFGKKNIFSFSDVALQNGIKKAKGYETLSKCQLEYLKKQYSPYCSYASLYYYAINDHKD